MPVRKKPTTYTTSDSREFEDKEEAACHEELITARGEYDEARKRFNRVLAQTQKTADGEMFDFGMFTDYYYITDYYNTQPSLKGVHFLGWNFEVSEYEDRVEISQNEGSYPNEHRYTYAINRLYADKKKAQAALILALESWLEDQRRIIAETKDELIRSGNVTVLFAALKEGFYD